MPMNQRYYLSFLLPSLFLSGCADAALPQACAHPDPSIRSGDTEVKVYFGCGCFWHVQHEFVVDEMTKLCRQDGNITARTAYAGGTHMDNGLVCYHNALGKADYGQLGHSEVVSMSVPVSAFATFAQTFWDICPKGVRRDVQDIGGEYRSVVGLPGGIHSSLMKDLASSATAKLVPGTGNEGDTLGSDTVIVYDSDHFPAHVAEKYHQFHDDMMDHYGGAYHALRGFADNTKCPGDQSWSIIS
ncbi:Peptide methionine sulfoxide reductase MsrA 1 (Protein-methionine-S-oxide reductase 1) (Peptide-methionine (S)-S-oxide reductase 1) (Peptide Met(O) reductase 1) [Durusdinium trenchii]|uniref:peptide-methionine (S)-S-oxide reductase n=1 Tax=Durusdinium trenchii TaxID=1381693 RepID=A0ABP0RSA6_9DINO